MHAFKAAPLSRSDIRGIATQFRRSLSLSQRPWFPVIEVIETVLPTLYPNYTFEVVDADELGSSHGLTERDGDQITIKLRSDIYERVLQGEGRDRGTAAHELGHLLLHAISPALHRHFGGTLRSFEDPEWQAKCFQGELLVPREHVRGMSIAEVVRMCGVSYDAAEYQMRLYNAGK